MNYKVKEHIPDQISGLIDILKKCKQQFHAMYLWNFVFSPYFLWIHILFYAFFPVGVIWHLKHNSDSIAVRLELRSHVQTKKQLLAICKRNTTDSVEKIASSISQALFEFFIFIVSFGLKSTRISTALFLQYYITLFR